MHYKNGREAKNGDKVVTVSGGKVIAGILYDAAPGNDFCNGQIAPINGGLPSYANLRECVHLEDFLASQPLDVPDLTKLAKSSGSGGGGSGVAGDSSTPGISGVGGTAGSK